MSSREHDEYVLGTHDEELERLGFQHRIWSAQAFAIWERAGFTRGQRLLDLGSGPGFATLDLARLVGPQGSVLAVDASRRFLDHLAQSAAADGLGNVRTQEVDVHQLDLPGGALDGAYTRWVLCFVTDPEAVVRRVAQALRPGGVFAIQDYFNYESMALAPRSKALERLVSAVAASWRARGGDPDVMGRMPGILERCGLRVREIRPQCRVARPGSMLWHWPTSFFASYLPLLVEGGFLTGAERQALDTEWAERTRDPHSFFCTPPVYDIIAERVAG